MAVASLSADQEDALNRMRFGCILKGCPGSGKSRTAIAFYYITYGGEVNTTRYVKMKNPADLYIITTAQKRDKLEWEGELINFMISTKPETSMYKNKVVIDSWNNIHKYRDVKDAFFIFDEQRLVGYGAWAHNFLKIAAKNRWILLTATPGDCWMDYMTVFIANGFFKNKTDFVNRHVIWDPFTKGYRKIQSYKDEARLIKFRNRILVELKYTRSTISHHETVMTSYDVNSYNYVVRNRWNVFENEPIENASEYCSVLRRIVNSSPDRSIKLLEILEKHPKAIIFYCFDYELEILRKLFTDINYPFAEWNGHKHEPLPTGPKWVYILQYTAGAEAWNCTTTDTMIFYSQTHSYKIMEQASGRINRRNTPYRDLYYFHFKSSSKIDAAISKALKRKKQFNERGFAPEFPKKKAFDVEKDCTENNSWDNPLPVINNKENIYETKSK